MNTASSLYRELTQEELGCIVEKHFGISKGFQSKLMSGGLFNTTYRIDGPQENRSYILRMGPVNRHLLLPFEYGLMQGEALFYRLLDGVDVPVPKAVACETGRSLIDRDYMITEYIPSVALSELKLAEELRIPLQEKVGEYTARIHGVTGEKFGRLGAIAQGGGFAAWSGHLIHETEEWLEKTGPTGIFSPEELQTVENLIRKNQSLFDEIQTPHLLHCDLWDGNILIGEENGKSFIAAIIDGDRAVFGDVDMEFASGWMINEPFLRGYGATLNMDEKHVKRRKLYSLMFNLADAYIGVTEYNNQGITDNNRRSALELMEQLSGK